MKTQIIAFLQVFLLTLPLFGKDSLFLDLLDYPRYSYPYSYLQEDLISRGETSLKVFTYGSLVDCVSAGKTLTDKTLRTRRPVIVYGAKRVFNRDVPVRPGSAWGTPNDSRARGMLNLVPTYNKNDIVNGVVMDVDITEINAILDREEGYDLIPVFFISWHKYLTCDRKNIDIANLEVAYTFHARKKTVYVSNDIFPRPNYYETSRNALKYYGMDFYSLWFSTTYMPDGMTPITEWEKRIQMGEPETTATFAH